MAPSSRNPLGFTPLPVTIFTAAVYIALFAVLLVTHHFVPSAPKNPTPSNWPGVNTTQAWLDLEHLSKDYHPFISRSNQAVRQWLVTRIEDILDANKIDWQTVSEHGGAQTLTKDTRSLPVTVFDDSRSNITYEFSKEWITYFEGENIMVYIRGSEDEEGDWWQHNTTYKGIGGVLVNAHYDSVSTGYGATDDGVGVVTVLQLISHFTRDGNQPKKGIVALLNNGEEDGLYGAKAFTQHPVSHFPHAFLNLEGAGAGGRATLFRSTDTEVTKFYAKSKYPFGSVVSGDGFKRGLIRSGTDYSVFTADLGMRGLDVAFMEPRARYHTSQDDARDTSIDSLWHMLSAALATVKGLSDDTSNTFEGPPDRESQHGKVDAGKGSTGVWFDVLGRAFAVIQLHTLFALSVTFLVAGPVLLLLLEIIIRKSDKWYPFARKRFLHSSDDDDPIYLYGWRGFFRFPIAFVVATAAVVALAYLFTKESPLIVYSSPYAVWSCMLGGWFFVLWFCLRVSDSVRPTALSRLYTLIWLYVLSWAALVAVTVGEDQLHLGSGYFVVIYNASVFVALLISYLELFALPKKGVYAEHAFYGPEASAAPTRAASVHSSSLLPADEPARGRDATAVGDEDAEDANERTSLLNNRQTFARYGRDSRRSEQADPDTPMSQDPLLNKAYGGEQAWSSSQPRWTWILQFLVVAPVNLILVGQIGLLAMAALHQTPADGNSVFTIYMIMAAISVLLLLPLSPFLHRLTFHIPTLLFFICVGTLIYNILAFPFSRDNRLKVYFFSQLDLDTGNYTAALTGLTPYVSDIMAQIPSAAAGSQVTCGHVDWAARQGLDSCTWATAPLPLVVPASYTPEPSTPYPNSTLAFTRRLPSRQHVAAIRAHYADWVSFNITTPKPDKHHDDDTNNKTTATDYIFDIRGSNTRACRLYLDAPIANLSISGAGQTFVPEADSDAGSSKTQIKLWSREWDASWRVRVSLAPTTAAAASAAAVTGFASGKHGKGVEGRVMCLWSDINQIGTIPALDEVKRFMPVWSTVSKGSEGLVEGYKSFRL